MMTKYVKIIFFLIVTRYGKKLLTWSDSTQNTKNVVDIDEEDTNNDHKGDRSLYFYQYNISI
jgi:hypothetical protein